VRSKIITKSDTAGEEIFAGDNRPANQLIEWVPSVDTGLFQTSPLVSKMRKNLKLFKSVETICGYTIAPHRCSSLKCALDEVFVGIRRGAGEAERHASVLTITS
jgi:hypothetical protein